MNEAGLSWDSIRDFRPGIVQRSMGDASGTSGVIPPFFGPGTKGSASSAGTFGCFALPTGSLAPLPSQDYTFNIAFNPGYTCPIVFQSGMTVMPQYGSGATIPDEGVLPANPNVGIYMGYIFANPTGTVMQHKMFRWALNHGNNSTTANVTNFIVQANSSANATTSSGVYSNGFEAINLPATAPTRDVAFYSEDSSGAAILNQSDLGLIGSSVNGQLVLQHQQRIVSVIKLAGQNVVSSAGGNTDVWTNVNETVQFSNFSIYSAAGPAYLGPEIPYGYGVIASQSASDLLMVKHAGGGLLVQGDLSTPIVRRLPELPSTFGTTCYGAATPVGYVYGQNHGGVYAWSGADTASLLSQPLQDGFWMPQSWISNGTAYTISPYRGKFTYWKDWVVTPNGWLFDSISGGWWLLQQLGVQSCSEFQVDPLTNRLFGALPSTTVTNNSLVPMIFGWNPTKPASSYQWTSNPMWMSEESPWQIGELREITLEIQGQGPSSFLGAGPAATISFQTDYTNGAFVNPVQIVPPSTYDAPTRVRVVVPQTPTPVRGSWIAFQLQVGGGTGAAPMVNALSWGTKPLSRLVSQ